MCFHALSSRCYLAVAILSALCCLIMPKLSFLLFMINRNRAVAIATAQSCRPKAAEMWFNCSVFTRKICENNCSYNCLRSYNYLWLILCRRFCLCYLWIVSMVRIRLNWRKLIVSIGGRWFALKFVVLVFFGANTHLLRLEYEMKVFSCRGLNVATLFYLRVNLTCLRHTLRWNII